MSDRRCSLADVDYVPFDATEEEVAARQVLRPGVPASMRAPLIGWIWGQLSGTNRYVKPEQLHKVANALDLTLSLHPHFTSILREGEVRKVLDNLADRDLIRTADFLLHEAGTWGRVLSGLDEIFRAGRSQYEVVQRNGGSRLATRLPAGVQAAAEQVMDEAKTAGNLLRRAWTKLYDIESDPSGAYAAAVKAVEAAALPVLGITKDTATISDAVRAIEKKDASWRLPFKREHSEYPSRDVLLGMLKSLYRGQRDRHGSDAYSDVTPQEAEAALLMAVALVGLFARDLVRERDVDTFG